MLPHASSCELLRSRSSRVVTDGARPQPLQSPASSTAEPTRPRTLESCCPATATNRTRGAGARALGLHPPPRGPQPVAAVAQGDLLQWPQPGEAPMWPDSWGGNGAGGSSSGALTASSSSSSAGGGGLGGGGGSSASGPATEALRPRRFSAPVIARLLRSTTSLQALADVVQQQAPYLDLSLVTVALLHLALLYSRQQQQRSQTASLTSTSAPLAATSGADYSNGSSISSSGRSSSSSSSSSSSNGVQGSSNGRSSSRSSEASLYDNGSSSSSRAGVAATAAPSSWSVEDDGLPLTMSSLLDDDDENDDGGGGNGGGDGGGSGGIDGSLDLGAAGGRGFDTLAAAKEQPSALLDAAIAVQPGPAPAPSLDEHGGKADGGEGGVILAGPRPEGGLAGRELAAGGSSSSSNNGGSGSSAASDGTGVVADGAAAAPTASPVGVVLRILMPLVLSGLDGVSGPDLSKVVSALAVLRYDNRVVVEQLLQVLSIKLIECSPQELSNLLVSLAMLGVPPDPLVRSNIYSAVKAQIRRLGPRDLSLTVWAYGAMGTDVQEDAVLVLLEASKPRLASFTPLHLAKIVQGLAALRYRPPPEWVAVYCEALRPALRRTAPRELCAVLLALADLQVSLDDTTRATLLVHTLTVLPSLEAPELALSLWALGRITAAGLSPALIDLDTSARVLDTTLVRLRQGAFGGGELQQLLEGLTRLALQPPLEWMQAYVAQLRPKLATLEPRQLAGVLGSLAAQQYRLEPEMQGVVMEATQANMRQLLADTTSTASLITALRRLNIEPPPSWVAALLEASRSALKNRATDLHLANLAGALAAWGVKPDGRWAARLMWRSQVLMQQGRMSPRALVALLQAMPALGLRPNAVWTDLCLYTAASRCAQPDFEPQHFSTLLPALHALDIRPPQEWLSRMMLGMYRCWERFSVAHWSSLLPALVLLKAEPPREWLQRLEDVLVLRLPDCSALQLLTLLVALAQLKSLGLEALEAASASTSTTSSISTSAAGAAVATAGSGAGASAGAELQATPPSVTPAAPPPAAATAAAAASGSIPADSVVGSSSSRSSSGSECSTSQAGIPLAEPRGRRGKQARPRARLQAEAETETQVEVKEEEEEEEAAALPSGRWLVAWWAASGVLLRRVRYAPSELLLTASWLVSLKVHPPREWLEACIDVSQRYSKVMSPAEQVQLAEALLPLAGSHGDLLATPHRRQPSSPPLPAAPAVAANPAPPSEAATAAAAPPPQSPSKETSARRRRRQFKAGKKAVPLAADV